MVSVMLPLKAGQGTGANVCFWLCSPRTAIIPISQMRMTRLGGGEVASGRTGFELDVFASSPALCSWVHGRNGEMGLAVATGREVV